VRADAAACVELVHRLVKDSDIVGINAPEWYVERMNRANAQWRQQGNVGALWGIHSSGSSSSSSSTPRHGHGEFGNGMILVIYKDGMYKRGKAFLEHCHGRRAFGGALLTVQAQSGSNSIAVVAVAFQPDGTRLLLLLLLLLRWCNLYATAMAEAILLR
jgi:hypothetical protein